MEKKKVLFVCVHNSGRSQIAEAYLKKLAGDRFEVQSAGFEPRPLNPLVVQVMAEDGIDISGQKAQAVFELYQQGKLFDYVVTVCNDSEGKCPLFPGITQRLHWPFPDPAALEGTEEEQLARARDIRDQIKRAIEKFATEQVA